LFPTIIEIETFIFKSIVMANQSYTNTKKTKGIFGINWFTLVLFIVLAFVFLQKDLSLNFNLNAPIKSEDAKSRKYNAPIQKAKAPKKKREGKLTEKASYKEASVSNEKGTSFFNMFDFRKKKKGKDFKSELDKVDEAVKQGYLKRFAKVAVSEQEKFKIPASIILANALLHSQAGKANYASSYQNHFAIPCGVDWEGGTGSDNGVCFRTYETAWTSFRDHSKYITSGKFAHLVELGPTNYKGWAKGLEKAKFSDAKNLSKNIIRIIEQYGLNDLDAS